MRQRAADRFLTCDPYEGMTPEVKEAADLIGSGMRLLVPFDGSQALLIPTDFCPDAVPTPVSEAVAFFIQSDQRFCKMTEHNDPPREPHKKHLNYRIGWREAGLPGEKGDLYSLLQ